jgi:hypothetical protein
VRAAARRCARVFLIPQAFDSNPGLTKDLAGVVRVIAAVARDLTNVCGVLCFSSGSRPGGYDQHPEIAEPWGAFWASVQGTPPPLRVTTPPAPRPPVPTPKPAPAPPPVPKGPMTIPPISDDIIIELAAIYDAQPSQRHKDTSAYLRDASYYGFGYMCLRAAGQSHEQARDAFQAAAAVDGYYQPAPPGMFPDDQAIDLGAKWTEAYQAIGRLQKQSNTENARDLIYWEIVYARQRVAGVSHGGAVAAMVRGMYLEAHLTPPGQAAGGGAGQHGFLRVVARIVRNQPFVDLVDEDGKPWLLAADTRHTLLCNVARGEDITGILDESVDLGANTVIVIGCHLSDWKKEHGFYLDPRQAEHPARMAALYDAAAAKGVRVYYRALADAQGLSGGEQRAIWQQAVDVARGRWNVFLTIGNEGGWGDQGGGANGWRSSDFSRPGDMGGVLVGRGSFGENRAPDPDHWDLAEWEPRREPIHKALDDCGSGVFELQHGYTEYPNGVKHAAVFVSEPMVFNDSDTDWAGDSGRWTEPFLARFAGVNIAAGGACGGAFISSDGMVCRPLGPIAAECGREFFRGLRSAFVR